MKCFLGWSEILLFHLIKRVEQHENGGNMMDSFSSLNFFLSIHPPKCVFFFSIKSSHLLIPPQTYWNSFCVLLIMLHALRPAYFVVL